MMSTLHEDLRRLYYDASKHSAYQSVPEFVEAELGFTVPLDHNWRSDKPRYEYLVNHLDFRGRRVIDIGANTGYFTLNLARTYGARVVAYEANPNHCEIIERIVEEFGVAGVRVYARGIGVDDVRKLDSTDIVLFSNVAHHAGHDYDEIQVPERRAVYAHLVAYAGRLAERAEQLVFQMGYNWGGNKAEPIVAVPDNYGKLVYTVGGLETAGWRIDRVAMAFRDANGIAFVDVDWRAILEAGSEPSIERSTDARAALCRYGISQDGMSEFYRRPLFLCTRGRS